MEDHKRFVRVESLALERIIQLKQEVGRPNAYFSRLNLGNKDGWEVPRIPNPYPESEGHPRKIRKFNPDHRYYFLKQWGVLEWLVVRSFTALLCDPNTHAPILYISIVYGKQNEESHDWELVIEGVWPASGEPLLFRNHLENR